MTEQSPNNIQHSSQKLTKRQTQTERFELLLAQFQEEWDTKNKETDKHRKSIADYTKELDDQKSTLNTISTDIKELRRILFVGDDNTPAVKKEIETARSEILEMLDDIKSKCSDTEDIKELRRILYVGDDNTPAVKKEIETARSEILKMLDDIKSKYSDTDKNYHRFFGKPLQNGDEQIIAEEEAKKLPPHCIRTRKDGVLFKIKEPGIIEIIDFENKQLKERLSKQVEHYETGYKALVNRLEGLLPSATAAGLASAYEEARNNHKAEETLWKAAGISSVISMLVIAGFFYCYIIMPSLSKPFDPLESFFQTVRWLAFESPCLILLFISATKLNQIRRIYEEYLHKKTLAHTYEGLRREAERLSDDANRDVEREVLGALLDAVKFNPSKTLEKHEKPIGLIGTFMAAFLNRGSSQNDSNKDK